MVKRSVVEPNESFVEKAAVGHKLFAAIHFDAELKQRCLRVWIRIKRSGFWCFFPGFSSIVKHIAVGWWEVLGSISRPVN